MFLKQLLITNKDGGIRRIDFHLGYNLIIDETPSDTSDTGNNVGKTTLLRLSQSLRTLNKYTRDVEYETLHLYLFGANIEDNERKVELSERRLTVYGL